MARTPEAPVNPPLLKWARESNGLSAPAAATALGVDLERLQAWESGSEKPSFAQLRKIANTYKRAPAVFFLTAPPDEPKVPKDFRVLDEKIAKRLAPGTLIEVRRAQARREYAVELAETLKEKIAEFKYKATLQANTEELGTEWRKHFGIEPSVQKSFASEYDAFNKWRRGIENLDVLVFQASLESLEEFRGLAVYAAKFPMILVNTKDSPRGKIFSMLHEFGHLLLHTSGIGNMEPPAERNDPNNQIEVFCNAFAGACLVPANLILNEPEIRQAVDRKQDISIETINALVKRYQASWEVILRRLLTTGVIAQPQYARKRTEIGKYFAGLPKNEGGFAEHTTKRFGYSGEKFTRLVLQGLEAGVLTPSDVSVQLGVKFNLLDRIEDKLKRRQA